MYSLGKSYKFQLMDRIFYTGKIIEEDELNIKIITIRNETIIMAKNHIAKSEEKIPESDIEIHTVRISGKKRGRT